MVGLNEQQQAAFTELAKFIEDGKIYNTMYCLKGYAGTGKTYTIARVVEHIIRKHSRWKVAMTAPTNKAVQVLREAANIDGVTYKTIHSLLGLKEDIKDSGEIEFVRDWDEPATGLKQFKVLIIDETSMLDDNLFMQVRRYNNDLKIIFMGDPAQIPPVNKEDCEPFLNPELHGIVELQLTKIMRQADGSAIASNGQVIRDNLTNWRFEFKQGDDLTVYEMPLHRKLLQLRFRDEFGAHVNARVIAWTNRKVDQYNKYIRSITLGNDARKITDGERLIMNAPYVVKLESGKEAKLSTNQEVEVIEFDYGFEDMPGDHKLAVYHCRVRFADTDGQDAEAVIPILNESDDELFKQLLAKLKKDAIESPMGERKDAWRKFYAFKRALADVSYAYAITAHKSQGSTYHTCFVDVSNISLNPNVVERNRILYTAITRAKHQLIIIQ